MESLETMETELNEAENEIDGLRESLETNRAANLTDVITKVGKMRGHITGLTPAQYREHIGREPSAALLRKLEGQTTKKIPWHMVLDHLASERGFDTDEELKEAIEDAQDAKDKIAKLEGRRLNLVEELQEKIRSELVDVKLAVITRECPTTKELECKAEVTEVNGADITARRQHSFWKVEVDLDGDGELEHSFLIRYAKEARQLVKAAIQDISETKQAEMKLAFLPTKRRREKVKRRPRTHRSREAPPSSMSGFR